MGDPAGIGPEIICRALDAMSPAEMAFRCVEAVAGLNLDARKVAPLRESG